MANQPIPPEVLKRWNEIARRLDEYTTLLESIADGYEKDRSKKAHEAIAATVAFLIALKKPRRILAPLVGAAEIVQEKMNKEGDLKSLPLDVAEKVIQIKAVNLHMACGLSEDEAFRAIVGNDPETINSLGHLKVNMLSRKKSTAPRGAKEFYDSLASDFKGLSPQEAAKKALVICSRMRGRKDKL
jgi:hypothetical protein